MTEYIDNGILINPDCAGIRIQCTIAYGWDGRFHVEIPNFELTPYTRPLLAHIFTTMGQLVLSEETK